MKLDIIPSLLKIEYDKTIDNVIFKVLPAPYVIKRLPQTIYVLDNVSKLLHRRRIKRLLKGCLRAEDLVDL